MRFFTNLRPETFDIYQDAGYKSASWLLSSHRISNRTLELAEVLRDTGADLMADNGTKPLIDIVTDEYREQAREIWLQYRAIRKQQGEPSMSSMPPEVRDPAADLAESIEAKVDEVISGHDWSATLDEQLRMDPTHLIAPEDFCIGCMTGLKLDRSIVGWSLDKYRRRNLVSLEGWELAVSDPRCKDRNVYVTLAAADYHSARHAALAAAEHGAVNVAVGFAGLNNLQTATEWTSLRRRRRLGIAAATRYVKLIEILFGIRDGYREAGIRLKRFHGLGLGSRAQYAVLPAALDWWTEISVDATSPIHDAVNGRVLYNHENQGRSSRVDKIASQVVDGDELTHSGAFTDQARTKHGHDPDAAGNWWLSVDRKKIEMKDLLPDQPLARALGWLASGPGSSTTSVTQHWIGHNHWVCDELAALTPSRQRKTWGTERIRELLQGQSNTVTRAANVWLQIIEFHDGQL